MKHRTVMPVWIRNILAVVIIGCFSVVFYYFFIRPYAYRWKPCHGLKEYGVCIPDGYDIHGIDISHYQGKIDWKRLLQNKETATPLHFVFMKATEGGDHNDTTLRRTSPMPVIMDLSVVLIILYSWYGCFETGGLLYSYGETGYG